MIRYKILCTTSLKLILMVSFSYGLCAQEKESDESSINAVNIIASFHENADIINSVVYKCHRIDTFASNGGTVWDHTGVALIEEDIKDFIRK